MAQTIRMPPDRRQPPPPPRMPRKPRRPVLVRYGRAWINGSEVGGTDPRYSHLDRSYD